jgi:predicted metal-dependent HD superfamily phosphohydrolase
MATNDESGAGSTESASGSKGSAEKGPAGSSGPNGPARHGTYEPEAVGPEAIGPGTTGPRDAPGGETRDKTRDRLLSRWNALLLSARGGAPDPDPVPYGRNLIERWSEPQRRYHTVDHLLDVLNRVDELAPHTPGADIDAVLLAAWFHDAVYRPDRSENEERSAALAERALPEAGVPQPLTDEAARLVRLTVDHDPEAGDVNGELLCDADLAVLAGSPGEYAQYAAAVRQEYGFVPDGPFLEGRAEVLRQLLGLPRLFRTPYGRERWEHVARRNMETEMELLVTGD